MKQIEKNVINSFRLAKTDLIKLQSEIIRLSQTQEKLVEMINEIKTYEMKLYNKVQELAARVSKNPATKTKTIVKTVGKRAKKTYVAPKTGKKFHVTDCPFAQNIKPKNKIKFQSKVKALNAGLKPCKCVK
ncbi:MAG: hypothetical protein ABIE94_03960 [archaeon]